LGDYQVREVTGADTFLSFLHWNLRLKMSQFGFAELLYQDQFLSSKNENSYPSFYFANPLFFV
jgi:hypothetical protein